MKNFIFITSIFIFFGCQQEEYYLETAPEGTSFLADLQLKGLINAIALHDGSYDDLIDNANCFSINFPYQIISEDTVKTINNITDLSFIQEGDDITLVFPVRITFANHQQTNLSNYQEMAVLQDNCETGLMENNFISCVDFEYPITIAVFDPISSNFSTIVFDHDRKTFQTIHEFKDNTLASIQYPIFLSLENSTQISVGSDGDLKSIILEFEFSCN